MFGRAPNFLPNDTEAVWQVAETAPVYILPDISRIRGGEVNLIVPDLDAQRVALEARSIVAEPIVVGEDAGRKSRVLDPDGNAI